MSLARATTRFVLQAIGLITVIGLAATVAAALSLPRFLQVEDAPVKADLIVPLAGEWHRYLKAAELYKAGYAPRVLLSNSRVRQPTRIDELRREMGLERIDRRAFRQRLLAHLGVPADATGSFGDGHISTVEEAEALWRHLKGKPARIILVTSPSHSRRARIVFRDVMPEATFMVTSPPEGRLARRWWRDQRSAQFVVSETFKLAYYLIGGRFRSRDGVR